MVLLMGLNQLRGVTELPPPPPHHSTTTKGETRPLALTSRVVVGGGYNVKLSILVFKVEKSVTVTMGSRLRRPKTVIIIYRWVHND